MSAPLSEFIESAKTWSVVWRVEKWSDSHRFQAGNSPDEVVVVHENALLYNGINAMLKLLCGQGGTAFTSGSAYLRVGNGTTAVAAATQYDLQGASKAEAPMDAGYPSIANNAVTFKSTFDESTGNFAWEEVGVQNGSGSASAAGQTTRLLNRKVQSFGTKSSGSVWTITLTITIT